MPKRIDVVIINWNSGIQLRQCINSLTSFAPDCIDKTIIIDNGSTDKSADGFQTCTDTNIIHIGQNLGFGKACNLGARQGSSEFILFLNPDAAIYEGTIQSSLEFMTTEENSKVGVCGVQLQDELGHISRSCTRSPTVKGLLAHSIGIDRIFPRLGHFMCEWDHNSTRSVDHVIGAFYLIRRSLFEDLGGFDERFFVYLEDLDLSNRVKAHGWDIKYVANIKAFHKGGGTSEQIKARRLFYSLRSRIIYAFKHFNIGGAILVSSTTLLIEPFIRTTMALARRSFSGAKETLTAYGLLISWLSGLAFNRR